MYGSKEKCRGNNRENMRAVVAIDSFKGSLSSVDAGKAVKEGIRAVERDADVTVFPVADGGEGTTEALTYGMGGSMQEITVTGPLGEPVKARYGVVRKSTAVMEMSAAAGLTLVEDEKKDPMITTTYGVGEMIRDAVEKGIRHFIVGIGGSATNDGGAGMLQALGYDLIDDNGDTIGFGAKGLGQLSEIRTENALTELKECSFRIACDVSNPLNGKNGASIVFGPQKGATSEMAETMDRWLEKYAGIVRTVNPKADPQYPGAGAAGGLGFAFQSFLKASLEPGIKIVLDETGLAEYIRDADIVITGEGRLDGQTVMGKAPVGVAELAKKYDKPVIAFSGSVAADAGVCNDHGIDAYFPVIRDIMDLNEAMEPQNAAKNLTDTAEQVFRLITKLQSYRSGENGDR